MIINCELSDRVLNEASTFLGSSGLSPAGDGWAGTLWNIPIGIWQGLVDKARRLAFHDAQPSANRGLRRVLFKTLLMDVLALLTVPETSMITSPPGWLSRLREDMHEEDNFIAGLPRLLEKSNHGQIYLNRVMKKYYSETPTEFINRLRIKKAAMMLSEGHLAAAGVMGACGFSNYSWFSRCFQRHFGMSPRQYIKLSRHR